MAPVLYNPSIISTAYNQGSVFSTLDCCCLYLQMEQLELKLASELPTSAKVVACRFPFPTWVPEETAGEGIDTVWVYDAKTFKAHMQHGMTKKTTTGHENTTDSHT